MRYDINRYQRIADLRYDADLNQNKVAMKINITQNTLSQYERGLRNIPNEILSKLADLYNTSTDYLLNRTDVKEPYPKKK